MIQSIPSAMIQRQGIVVLVQQSERRERAQAKIAATSRPIILIADKPLPATTTQIAGYLPEGKIHLAVESTNVLLKVVPPNARPTIEQLGQRALDLLIRLAANQGSAHEFTRAMSGIQHEAIQLRSKLHPAEPMPRRDKNAFRDPAVIEQVRVGKNTKQSNKLHELLVNLLDIREVPLGKILRAGEMTYELKESAFGDHLIILRRTPDGSMWFSTERQRITTRQQAQAALFALELEHQHAAGMTAEKPTTWIIKRAEVRTIEDAAQIIERMDQAAIGRANAATQAAWPKANPFSTSAPQLAAGR
jgi:hypothetical protein